MQLLYVLFSVSTRSSIFSIKDEEKGSFLSDFHWSFHPNVSIDLALSSLIRRFGLVWFDFVWFSPATSSMLSRGGLTQVFGSNLSPLEPDVTEAIEEALPEDKGSR